MTVAGDVADAVNLRELMQASAGSAQVPIGLVHGPVAQLPELASVQWIGTRPRPDSGSAGAAWRHGTAVAGILHAQRDSPALGVCPQSPLLVRPIFTDASAHQARSGVPVENAGRAIVDCVDAGARIVNLSVAPARLSPGAEHALEEALAYATRKGVLVVAAAGNHGTVSSSALARHTSVLPVVACDHAGRPTRRSNLGPSLGRRGLRAPGEALASLDPNGEPIGFSGTSAATPVVTGAAALLWSLAPRVTPGQLKTVLLGPERRRSVTPPLLNAGEACRALTHAQNTRREHA